MVITFHLLPRNWAAAVEHLGQFSISITPQSGSIFGQRQHIKAFVVRTGYTEKAVRRKIDSGIWVEGIHFRRAPDGHITMNMLEYYRWVEGKVSS